MTEHKEESIHLHPSGLSAPELSPGTKIDDKYEVVSLIGSGGMGTVYKVHQVFLGKEFALKVLDLHKLSDLSVRRFQQEARTASQLQHPNLVEVHDFGVLSESQPYLVMDLVEGDSLAQTLKKTGALPVDYTVALCIQICFGLMYAHEKGVVHRDIKPANIMLVHPDRSVTEGTVKVVDFGIAKLTQSDDGEIQSLTKTGEIFGSPLYMSPEQCRGAAVDRRSDIYSLGCVMFECLTGSPPFFGDTAMSTMLKRLSEEPVSLKEGSLGREFPPLLEQIVRRMLATDPNHRYQDFGAVVKDLIALQRSDDQTVASRTLPEKAEQKDSIVSKQTLVLIAAAVVSSIATAAYDRLVVFPSKSNADSNVSAGKKATEKNHSKPSVHDEAMRFSSKEADALVEGIGLGVERKYPELRTESDSRGQKRQYIFFPIKIGRIGLQDEEREDAKGKFYVPPGQKISLQLDSVPSEDRDTLKNLTGLNYSRIDLPSDTAVVDHHIALLEKMKGLERVGIAGTSVQSLKPFYKAGQLVSLEASGTLVPSAEFLKLKNFKKLKTLSFGPVKDPQVIFNALAASDQICILGYRGARSSTEVGTGLSPSDIAALSRLTGIVDLCIESCPAFDDAGLKQLLKMRNLHTLKVRDCGLTAKSLSTLKKFENLKLVTLTTEGWSDADRAALKGIFGDGYHDAQPKTEGVAETVEYARSLEKLQDN